MCANALHTPCKQCYLKGFVTITLRLILKIIELFCFMFRRHDNTLYVWQLASLIMPHVT